MTFKTTLLASLICGTLGFCGAAAAAVSAEEAAKLKTVLTPAGAEKAGNKDGTISAWDGGLTKPLPGFKNGGKRDQDPFANEKPLYTVTARNMDQYADKLSDGVKAMLKKYPNTYRLDVYPTHRTAAAPQWVYDNIAKNATRAKLDDHMQVTGAFGGTPFPIPKNGAEVMMNHILHWRGSDVSYDTQAYLVTSDGKPVLTVEGRSEMSMPYYNKEASSIDSSNGVYWMIRLMNSGPPIRAGEGIVGRENLVHDQSAAWVYLAGQRRVRKLPMACCDTPTPASAGVMTFDELHVFEGRLDRFDWKLVGKKEMLIPYNSNKILKPQATDVVTGNHLNPDHVRWELHRVWVVEASLKQGQRHVAPKGVYYIDEDSWLAVLGDRWDAKGQLWKTMWNIPVVMPDIPAVTHMHFGFYDLVSNTWFANQVLNNKNEQYKAVPRFAETNFTPEAMSGGLR